ncbi:MAG: ubiquinol-cytochrome C chaperone [Brevundimonas sp.]|uniref:ubiquinol-cytochrome C chaperone family protein n=1 Tax=Brevundimonas sp. TaxID=1871086 RepID=UPI0011FBB7BB|nr:ubiquinol-cytochrome C chaperone family protein [Brevundimonas sp.]RZJ19316.1 MAG: ubiquinol-cytochrome C chaperone [Brevundimonas sp.]
MFAKLLGRRANPRIGDTLYGFAVEQARTPAFYTRLGVADRIDARFELYTLHVLLLVMRLRDEGETGADMGQTLFDTYVSALDHALRELGVGDISVGKKMRKLGEALYGRMTAYEAPLRAGDTTALSDALAKNIYEGDDATGAPALAAYAVASRAQLATQSLSDITKAPKWAEISQ